MCLRLDQVTEATADDHGLTISTSLDGVIILNSKEGERFMHDWMNYLQAEIGAVEEERELIHAKVQSQE